MTYYQTLDQVNCLLRQEKKYKRFEKTWKKLQILSKNFQKSKG